MCDVDRLTRHKKKSNITLRTIIDTETFTLPLYGRVEEWESPQHDQHKNFLIPITNAQFKFNKKIVTTSIKWRI